MNKHKQLKKLGTDPSVFFDDAVESKKSKKHIKKERKKYGCSTHEVYNLDKTMPMWLYEHLILYKKCAIDFVDFGAANGLYNVPVALKFGISWHLAVLFALHFLIDETKARMSKITYMQDQILHYFCLLVFLMY